LNLGEYREEPKRRQKKEMVDLEKMRVRDLIVYYLRNQKRRFFISRWTGKRLLRLSRRVWRRRRGKYRDSTLFCEFGERPDKLSGKRSIADRKGS
jgi:hypothetical protein